MRIGISEDMKDMATKRAKKVIKEIEKGLDRENFEYEFNNLYPFNDSMMLDMDELFGVYDNQK